MIFSAKDLIGYTVYDAEGEIGQVTDIFFDDNRWRVRYLKLLAGDWLENRPMLLATRVIDSLDRTEHQLRATLDRRQASPFTGDQRMTRAEQSELHQLYEWPFYWDEDQESGIGAGSPAAMPLIELASEIRENLSTGGVSSDPNLHSLNDLLGARIEDREEDVSGTLDDMALQDDDWQILYLVIDTGGLLPGKHVSIAPTYVTEIDEDDKYLQLDLDRETIHNSPEWEAP